MAGLAQRRDRALALRAYGKKIMRTGDLFWQQGGKECRALQQSGGACSNNCPAEFGCTKAVALVNRGIMPGDEKYAPEIEGVVAAHDWEQLHAVLNKIDAAKHC